MGKSEFEKSMLKAVPNHTHKYTATLITGTGGEGEIYLRCEDTCPIGSSIIFPHNPRKYYGEQIAKEIKAKICYDFHCVPDEQDVCNVMRLSLLDAAAIARGEK